LRPQLADEPVVGCDQGTRFFRVATLLDRSIHRLPFEIPRRDFPRGTAGFEPLDDLSPVVPGEADADFVRRIPHFPVSYRFHASTSFDIGAGIVSRRRSPRRHRITPNCPESPSASAMAWWTPVIEAEQPEGF